nr:histone deacetylase 5 isoform X5 [Chrysemys picta bellii]
MLLMPRAQGLPAMLQTIYESESCFSSDGVSGREQSLELLSRTPLHGLPVAAVDVKPVLPVAMQNSCGGGGSGGSSPVDLRTDARGSGPSVDPAVREQQLQQELLVLKQQQQLQKQLLFAEFQKQHEHLTRQHEVQLQKHLKQQQEMLAAKRQQELEHQRKQEQLRQEELEKQRLEQQLLILRNKEKSKESAIASTEVKLKLQEFLLSKSKELTAGGFNHSLPQHPKCWGAHHTSLDQSSPPQTGSPGTPPSYKLPLLGTYDSRDDFPLRKTASEPNLKVRSRLKQKVAERRSSPLLRRKDGTVISTFKKRAIEITVSSVCNSAPGSGPSSPNSSNSAIAENGFTGSAPNIHTELLPQHRALAMDGSASQLSLYTSPSLPNISLGLQATVTVTNSHLNASPKLSTQQEAERQAIQSLRQGGALTGKFMSTSSIPGCLLGVALEGETNSHGHASLLQHVLLLEQARQQNTLIAVPLHGQSPLVTGERISTNMRTVNKLPRHRPLSRTQSSPLPQSPQALQQLVMQQQHQQFLEKQKQQQQIQLGKIITKTGELPRQPTTHPEETEEELTEQQEVLLEDTVPLGPVAFVVDGSPESESTQDELEEDEGGEPVKDEGGASGDEDEHIDSPEVEELGVAYKQVFPDPQPLQPIQLFPASLTITTLPHQALSRTQSSPAATGIKNTAAEPPVKHLFTTGVIYDTFMLKHQCMCGNTNIHPEHAGRIQSIWSRLQETGLLSKCERIRGRKATLDEIQTVHSEHHTLLYGTSPLNRQKLDSKKLLVQISRGGVRGTVPSPGRGVGSWLSVTAPSALPRSHQPEDVCGLALRRHRGGQRHGVERDALVQRRPHGCGLFGGVSLQGGLGRAQEWICCHPAPGAPRGGIHGHGLLLLQLRRYRCQTAPTEAQRRQDPHCGLGHSPWQRHPASLLQRPQRAVHLPAPLRQRQLLPRQRGPRGGWQWDGGGVQRQHSLDGRRGPPHRRRGVPGRVQDGGDADSQRVLPGRGPGLCRLRCSRGTSVSPGRLLRHGEMFRTPDQAADEAGRRARGAGFGGRSRPDSHLRRLRSLCLRPAWRGAGPPGSSSPAAKAKCKCRGHPGEGY